jgi:uncharacterized protein (DUF58 family)
MDKITLAKRAYLLQINSRNLAEGMRSGSFKSLYRGHGIDFNGVREYIRGDDVRSIDWNVTARNNKPYVKVFNEERDLDVLLLIDRSLSMDTGCGNESRLETAFDCASLMTMACQHNSSSVGAVIFDGAINFSCAPKPGYQQAMMLLTQYEKNLDEVKPGTALESALQGVVRLLKKRSLVMIFSDFRVDGWDKPFAQLCHKHDVVAVRITDPLDDQLPSIGSVYFEDPETHTKRVYPTSASTFQRKWREANLFREDLWKREVIRRGGIPFILSTASDPAIELTRFFASREQR